MVNLDPQDYKDSEDHLEEWDQEVPWDLKEKQEEMEEMEKQENQEFKEFQEDQVQWATLEIRVQWEIKVLRDHLVYQVPLDLGVILVKMVPQEHLDHLGKLVQLEKEAWQDPQDQEDSRECQDLQEKMENLVEMVLLECRDHLA